MSVYTKYINEKQFMIEPVSPICKLKSPNSTKDKMEVLILKTQYDFCKAMEELESGSKFICDKWIKDENSGGGISCVLENGSVFERAGVNISVVDGILTDEASIQMRQRGIKEAVGGNKFSAVGISSVIHPKNPFCPTMHFNFRFFEIKGADKDVCWFGGGADLTPYYLYEEDCKHFHQTFKDACDKFNGSYYPEFKKWCDEYFYLPHRKESRGVGGIFFDDLNTPDVENCLDFIKECSQSITKAYIPIIKKRMVEKFTEENKSWQKIRRGRYVEFNLLYDRGTKFGIYTPGSRTESILVSMPPEVSWKYNYEPIEGTEESRLLKTLRCPRNWV